MYLVKEKKLNTNHIIGVAYLVNVISNNSGYYVDTTNKQLFYYEKLDDVLSITQEVETFKPCYKQMRINLTTAITSNPIPYTKTVGKCITQWKTYFKKSPGFKVLSTLGDI